MVSGDCLIVQPIHPAGLDRPRRAGLQLCTSTATDTAPLAVREATQAGIAAVNTPGTNARSVAEHAVASMLAFAKMLTAADRATRAGNVGFKYSSRLIELHGRTLGLIGFGNIGQI